MGIWKDGKWGWDWDWKCGHRKLLIAGAGRQAVPKLRIPLSSEIPAKIFQLRVLTKDTEHEIGCLSLAVEKERPGEMTLFHRYAVSRVKDFR
jgi:hypothetical protein